MHAVKGGRTVAERQSDKKEPFGSFFLSVECRLCARRSGCCPPSNNSGRAVERLTEEVLRLHHIGNDVVVTSDVV